MWPMLAGIGPVLGGEDENLGEFFNTSGHSVWRYRDGVAAEVDNGKVGVPSVEGSAYHLAGMPEVAVLIDRSTGSSGEAIAIAFRGRTGARFFEHTAGVATVNEPFELSDGATLWLTIGIQADRNGKQYIDGLGPDEAFAATESMQTSSDPVVQAALDWLSHSVDSSKTGR